MKNKKDKDLDLWPFQDYLTYIEMIVYQGGKPEYPEKKYLTYRCRTRHLTCDPSVARTTAVREPMFKSQRSYYWTMEACYYGKHTA